MNSRITTFLNKVESTLGVPRPTVVVLNFKDVLINNFVEQINFLEELNYKFITSSEIAEFVAGSRKINEKSVALTFDVTNIQITSFALHFLASRNIPATIFANQHTNLSLVPENWEIGSLGITKKETLELKDYLEEKSGRRVKTLAFANTRYDKHAIKSAKKAGYIAAFHSKYSFPKSTKTFLVPRITVKKSHKRAHFDSFFRNWTSLYWLFSNIFVRGEFSGIVVKQNPAIL